MWLRLVEMVNVRGVLLDCENKNSYSVMFRGPVLPSAEDRFQVDVVELHSSVWLRFRGALFEVDRKQDCYMKQKGSQWHKKNSSV